MAEESNVHTKMAMAEVLGLYMIALIGILVGCYGLGVFDGLGVIIESAPTLVWVCSYALMWPTGMRTYC